MEVFNKLRMNLGFFVVDFLGREFIKFLLDYFYLLSVF